MTITYARSLKIGLHLRDLIVSVNAISEEELKEYLRQISYNEAMGPMLDPTKWRDEDLFTQASQSKKVLSALLDFKQAVKGIGNFT